MSVQPLRRFTLVGARSVKTVLLDDLQTLGCAHLVPLVTDMPGLAGRVNGSAAAALAFLRASPLPRHPAPRAAACDIEALQRDTHALRENLQALADERDALRHRLRELAPWGDFALPGLDAHPELRFWFYLVPHHRLADLARTDLAWRVVNRDRQQAYVVVIAAEEPVLGFARAHTGPRRQAELAARLASVEIALDDAQAARAQLARWSEHLAAALRAETDREQRELAGRQAVEGAAVFALAGYIPADAERALRELAERRGATLQTADPAPDEEPPTLLDTPASLSAGDALLRFYLTPGYRALDPSVSMLFAFAAFFAFIVSDAGYASVLATFAWLAWRRRPPGAWRGWGPALSLIGVSSIGWGIACGSWFGLAPSESSVFARLAWIDFDDTGRMMGWAGALGAAHLACANLAVAWHQRHTAAALAPLGWVLILAAFGRALAAGVLTGATAPAGTLPTLGIGAVAVLLYAGAGQKPGARALGGLLALTRALSAVGDTLSYLRLFALALAGASLAGAVNAIALLGSQLGGLYGAGVAAAVLVGGHALNLVLGLAGGVIHGLRLNYIEFLNWSVAYEGYPFRAFRRTD